MRDTEVWPAFAEVAVLAENVTLRDLSRTLAEPEEFVRRVLGAMHVERKARGAIVVRLGRTGTGVAPNYRFDAPDGEPLVAYNGANHQPWPPNEKFDIGTNWSTITWTYDELASYRGELGSGRRP